VKFHAVNNDFFGRASERNQENDFYHWSAILRSVSAFEVYRKVYRDVITPGRVADLLILRRDMPRSLHASLREVVDNLAWWPTTSRPRPSAAPGGCWPICNMAASTKSWPRACTLS
jgi:uncharacterized alpha-E superfamily protein